MGSPSAEHAAALAEETSDAPFGDARLSKRQTKLTQKLAQAPDKNFPSLLRLVEAAVPGEEAKLEQALAQVQAVAVREVELSPPPASNHSPQQKRLYPSPHRTPDEAGPSWKWSSPASVDTPRRHQEAGTGWRKRRAFTPEFKAEVVRLAKAGDRSIGQVAKDLHARDAATTKIAAARVACDARSSSYASGSSSRRRAKRRSNGCCSRASRSSPMSS
ncbi:transposase DNA-binding-containing protein [Sorangium sp. So ce136]